MPERKSEVEHFHVDQTRAAVVRKFSTQNLYKRGKLIITHTHANIYAHTRAEKQKQDAPDSSSLCHQPWQGVTPSQAC